MSRGESSSRYIRASSVQGKVRAPTSKSMMQRAVAAAVFSSSQRSVIIHPTYCDDVLAVLSIAEVLGCDVQRNDDSVIIERKGGLRGSELSCGESGLCMRMFTPLAALYDVPLRLTCRGSLMQRPVSMMEKPLKDLGVSFTSRGGYPPVDVCGPMVAGRVVVDGSTTSQFLTGLLMALPLCKDGTEVEVLNLQSGPYIEMTLSLLDYHGIEVERKDNIFYIPGRQKFLGRDYVVEGDWSGASFLLVAGAISGSVEVVGLDYNSLQGDKKIVEVLEIVGADIVLEEDSITVSKNELNGFDYDATDCPDLFPPLVALACYCRGHSTIKGAERLRHKESNRAAVLCQEFGMLGATISWQGDIITIEGGELAGGDVDAHGDHRIAMACAVAALKSHNGVNISGWESVSKSYPDFFKNLALLGAGNE